MRSLWTGSISFGLISIPVTLYSAAKERALDFAMLRKDDLCPISFKRVCRNTGEEVPYDQIVKGYEYRDGDYVILNEEDFKRANPEASERIDIEEFVDEDDIAAKYYEKPYYLEPGKGADKAYLLLREALAQEKKVAVARMVFRAREDLVVLKPDGDLLVLLQLRYEDEIRDPKELTIPKNAHITRQEVGMAIELIEKMKGKFNPKNFHDTYTEKLEKIIEQKAHGKKFAPLPKTPHEPTEHTDLIAQLRASLDKHAR